MKAIDKQWEAAGRPGSIEIKVSPLRFNAWCFVCIVLLIAGSAGLFTVIWESSTAYDWGHFIGALFSLSGLLKLAGVCAAYLVLDWLMLYLTTGCDRGALHWHCDAAAFGPYTDHPVLLGYYRLMLVAPGVLLGFFPAAYGLCTGNAECYGWGLWAISCALFDLSLFWRLRYYKNHDYYLSTGKSYEGWLIVRHL